MCLTYSVGVGVLILLVSSRLKDFFILPVQVTLPGNFNVCLSR